MSTFADRPPLLLVLILFAGMLAIVLGLAALSPREDAPRQDASRGTPPRTPQTLNCERREPGSAAAECRAP